MSANKSLLTILDFSGQPKVNLLSLQFLSKISSPYLKIWMFPSFSVKLLCFFLFLIGKNKWWAADPSLLCTATTPLTCFSCTNKYGYHCNTSSSHLTCLGIKKRTVQMHLAQESLVGLLDSLHLTVRIIYLCSAGKLARKRLFGDQIVKFSFY